MSEELKISEHCSVREICLYMTGLTKNHIVSICMHINSNKDYKNKVPLYGNKKELISGLSNVEHGALLSALSQVVGLVGAK